MRDEGRDRERNSQLSLHPRQVVSIVLGSAVVLGIVFYLGVTVGKDLAAPAVAAPGDLLGALDEKAARADDRLTFADELTKADRVPEVPAREAPKQEAPRPSPPAEAPAQEVAARAEAPAAELPSSADPVETPQEAPPARAPVRDLSAALLQASSAGGGRAAGSGDGSKAVGAGSSPATSGGAESAPPSGGAAKAVAIGGGSAKPAGGAVAPAQGPSFTVQVASLPNRSEAEALASRLRKQGLSPWVAEADIPGKGTFYRVRVGRFANREEAVRYLDDLKRETRMDGFVASVDH